MVNTMNYGERKKELDELDRLIGNPLNAMKVFAPFKRLRAYFVLSIYDNIVHKVKMSLGRKMLYAIFECDQLLPRCQFGTLRSKLAATVEFLHHFAFLLSAVEFLAINDNLGVSVRQATEMVMLIKEIQDQMGGFEKYLRREPDNNEYRQSLQPTGQEGEQV